MMTNRERAKIYADEFSLRFGGDPSVNFWLYARFRNCMVEAEARGRRKAEEDAHMRQELLDVKPRETGDM